MTAPARQLARAAPPPTRLVIVDDHDLARAGLRSILACEARAEVIGEAASGQEALALCRRLRPDVVLMDVHMPDLDGLAATRALKQEQPGLHVILITMHESPDYLLEALRAGASGYLLKGASRQMIMGTVRRVLRGQAALHPELAAQLLRQMAVGMNGNAARLTTRELEILRLLSKGWSARFLPSEQAALPLGRPRSSPHRPRPLASHPADGTRGGASGLLETAWTSASTNSASSRHECSIPSGSTASCSTCQAMMRLHSL